MFYVLYWNKAFALFVVLINDDLSLARCLTDRMVQPVPWVYEVKMAFLKHVALCVEQQ